MCIQTYDNISNYRTICKLNDFSKTLSLGKSKAAMLDRKMSRRREVIGFFFLVPEQTLVISVFDFSWNVRHDHVRIRHSF